jgi:hypothetical protein
MEALIMVAVAVVVHRLLVATEQILRGAMEVMEPHHLLPALQ